MTADATLSLSPPTVPSMVTWTVLLMLFAGLACLTVRLFRPGYGTRRAPRHYEWET